LYNRCMERYEFSVLDQMTGGFSKSPAKVEAARANGRKCKKGTGGRPSTRTLIERVLDHPVTPDEWKRIREKVFTRILVGHQQLLPDFFDCDWNETPRRSWRSLPRQVRQMIRHIKATAKIFLPKTRLKPPKDYVVVRVEKHPGEREAWERRYPDMPFVMTRPKKIPISTIMNYDWFDRKFAHGVDLDEDDILRNCEGNITRETAVALLKHLKFKHARS
jgi:hypothetical protein